MLFSRLLQNNKWMWNILNRVMKNRKYTKSTATTRLFKFRDIMVPLTMGVTFYNNFDKNYEYDYNFLKSSSDLEEDVMKKVFTGPEPELIELMDVLKQCIVESCAQYRTCLKKQIEIIERSTKNGLFSDTLDELPEYRTLASDLNHELNNYVTLLKTVGEMTYQHLITSVEDGSFQNVNKISEKYKDLEIILQHQLDQNRKCELELNNANRLMILSSKVDY